jgi:lipid-A-disaccharide synthase-like uncharacterized protein
MNDIPTSWLIIGFLGQALFSMRFLIQWIYSEKNKRSIIPKAFWYFSLAGGITLFTYALYREDPVFILGQGLGIFIYIRNLMLIRNFKVDG